MSKHRIGQSGHQAEIEDGWLVLDVGSGHSPASRADILMDITLGTSIHRSGASAKADRSKPFVVGDARFMPFKAKVFDYVIASHIAEHLEEPDRFCHELTRVGKRGYIETPSKSCEHVLGEPFHIWFIYSKDSNLVFERKVRPAGTKWVYGLFYYGRERVGDRNLSASNRWLDSLYKTASRVVRRLAWVRPVRRRMHTCFDWEQSFDFEVKEQP